MSLRVVQCSEYTGDTGAMAFTFATSFSYNDEPTIDSGDSDATPFIRPPPPLTPTRRGVNINRKLRPGWWLFEYSYDMDGGTVTLSWSMWNAAGLGDTSQGSEPVSTTGTGSGSWEVRAVSVQDHFCAGILFGIAIELGYIGTFTVTRTWLACAACAEPV